MGKGGALEKVQKTAEDVKEEFQNNDEPARVQENPSGCLEGRGVVHVLAHSIGRRPDGGAVCRRRPCDRAGGLYAHSARKPRTRLIRFVGYAG